MAGRALQGAFGALLTPSALAVIIAAFAPSERGAAIGSWTAWSAIATVIGPLAGGYLVDAVSWRLIFAINVPFVAVTLALIFAAVPARERGAAHARVDWIGAVLTFLGLAGPVLALIRQPVAGWGSPEVWGPGLGGLALLGLFLAHERRTPAPMLPLGPVPAAQLRRRQRRDVRHVRRAQRDVLLPRAVPPAGRGLRRAGGRAGADAGDARDVRAVQARRAPRRPPRPAAVHGPRAAHRGARSRAHAAPGRRTSTTRRTCCRPWSSSRSGSRRPSRR